MQTLLVAIAKQENRYLKEWVEYNKKIGFDNIVICDNNDFDGEKLDDVIGDYISDGYVIVEDWREKKYFQCQAYEWCYRKYNKNYDWIAFFDVDEFFTMVTESDIHKFLADSKFEKYSSIHVNWLCYGDNDLIEPDDRPVVKRFINPVTPVNFTKLFSTPENSHCKAFLRGGLENVKFPSPHNPNFRGEEGKICDATGKVLAKNEVWMKMNYRSAYIRHYATKTIYEYINKIKRGDAIQEYNDSMKKIFANSFFCYNKRTPEKEEIIKKELGYDVSMMEMKRKDVQLFMLCYDKKDGYDFVDNEVMTPLQCGAVNGKDVCRLKDNTGENLSGGNFFYVENTGIFWIWRNIKDAKYKGQTQYRRRLVGIDEKIDYDEIFKNYDIICAKPYNFPANKTAFIPADTVEEGYGYSHCIDDLKSLETIIKEMHPDYAADYDKYIKNGENLYYSNGFVLPAREYDRYCEFLFNILNAWLVKNNCTTYEDVIVHVARNLGAGKYIRYPKEGVDPMTLTWPSINWQVHIGGFLSERILTLYIYHNFPRRYEVDYEKMEDGMYI